jgi:isoleucyl-tRNA synthetase
VLLGLSKIAAPFTPFISETIYQNLKTDDMPGSVHLCDFPTAADAKRDEQLEWQMSLAMNAVEQGRTLRAEYKLKNRQPLSSMDIVCGSGAHLARMHELEDIIKDELNVKEVWFSSDASRFATTSAKPNFKKLGPKVGPLMKKVASVISNLTADELQLDQGGFSVLPIKVDDQEIELLFDDIEIIRTPKEGMAVSEHDGIVVALTTELNDDLITEGLAREFVNKIQSMRKEMDLEVTQRIHIAFSGDEAVGTAVAYYLDYIESETLALSCREGRLDGVNGAEWTLNGHPCSLFISTA